VDQLIELLKQIQELAGVGIDALSNAGKAGGSPDKGGEPAPSDGENPDQGKPPAGPPHQ
jgi:hypothetical protein